MGLRETRFSLPSGTAIGVGVMGVLSVGLISGGLWYDSHRSAEAVDRAREQVASEQTSQATPEQVASTMADEPTTKKEAPENTTSTRSATSESVAPAPREEPVMEQATASVTDAATDSAPTRVPAAASRQASVAPQPVQPAPVVPVAPVAPAQPVQQGPAADESGQEESTDPEIAQPVEPGGDTPPQFTIPDLIRPFLPVPNAPQRNQNPAGDTGANDFAAESPAKSPTESPSESPGA